MVLGGQALPSNFGGYEVRGPTAEVLGRRPFSTSPVTNMRDSVSWSLYSSYIASDPGAC